MVSVFRILFDVSVYYTISGLYLQAFFGGMPSLLGYTLLCTAMLLYGVLSSKLSRSKWIALVFLVPFGMLSLGPSAVQIVQMVPALVYASVALILDRADIAYDAFFKRIFKALGLLGLSMIPVLLALKPAFLYLQNVLLYLVFASVSGVSCMRNLRDRAGGLRHAAIVSSFAGGCGVLVYFEIPQRLLSLLHNGILFGLHQLEKLAALIPTYFNKMPDAKKQKGGVSVSVDDVQIPDYFSEDYTPNALFLKWLEVIVAVALVGLAVFLLVKLFVGLIRDLRKSDERQPSYNWSDEVVRLRTDGSDDVARKRKRPGNPRMTVRYYYWKFMQECRKRGIQIQKGWTVEELCQATKGQFRDADVFAFQQLYIPIRYDDCAVVGAADAREAARLWHELKKSKPGV